MFRKMLICLLAGAMLAGCETTGGEGAATLQAPHPVPAQDVADRLIDVELPPDQVLIYLYRPSAIGGSANTYRFTINGVEVADMATGTRFAQIVPPGQTTVQGRSLPNILNLGLAVLMMEKPSIAFDADEGMVYIIEVATGFAGGPQLKYVDADRALAAITKLKPAKAPKAK